LRAKRSSRADENRNPALGAGIFRQKIRLVTERKVNDFRSVVEIMLVIEKKKQINISEFRARSQCPAGRLGRRFKGASPELAMCFLIF
jgi:hypothetical protein